MKQNLYLFYHVLWTMASIRLFESSVQFCKENINDPEWRKKMEESLSGWKDGNELKLVDRNLVLIWCMLATSPSSLELLQDCQQKQIRINLSPNNLHRFKRLLTDTSIIKFAWNPGKYLRIWVDVGRNNKWLKKSMQSYRCEKQMSLHKQLEWPWMCIDISEC